MEQEALAALAGLLIFLILACGGGAIYFMRGTAEKEAAQPVQQQVPQDQGAPVRPRRGLAAARRRRHQAEQPDDDEEAGENLDPAVQQRVQPETTYSRKDAYEERRRKRDEEREAQQLAEEQEQARREAERQAAEDAEAAKWLGQISTEREGTDALDSEEQQGLLAAFVDHIKTQKTVVLEDLAADFNMRVQDVISRVQTLESEGRITGIMDDRGKFIYISQEEMKAVADYIKSKGRVSITELAAKSNTLIDLEAKALAVDSSINLDLDLDNDDFVS